MGVICSLRNIALLSNRADSVPRNRSGEIDPNKCFAFCVPNWLKLAGIRRRDTEPKSLMDVRTFRPKSVRRLALSNC